MLYWDMIRNDRLIQKTSTTLFLTANMSLENTSLLLLDASVWERMGDQLISILLLCTAEVSVWLIVSFLADIASEDIRQ